MLNLVSDRIRGLQLPFAEPDRYALSTEDLSDPIRNVAICIRIAEKDVSRSSRSYVRCHTRILRQANLYFG